MARREAEFAAEVARREAERIAAAARREASAREAAARAEREAIEAEAERVRREEEAALVAARAAEARRKAREREAAAQAAVWIPRFGEVDEDVVALYLGYGTDVDRPADALLMGGGGQSGWVDYNYDYDYVLPSPSVSEGMMVGGQVGLNIMRWPSDLDRMPFQLLGLSAGIDLDLAIPFEEDELAGRFGVYVSNTNILGDLLLFRQQLILPVVVGPTHMIQGVQASVSIGIDLAQ